MTFTTYSRDHVQEYRSDSRRDRGRPFGLERHRLDSGRCVRRDLRDVGNIRLVADRRGLEPGGRRAHPDRRVGAHPHHPRPGAVAWPVGPAAPGWGPGSCLRPRRSRGLPAVLLQRDRADAGRRCPAAGISWHGTGGRLAVAAPRPAGPAARGRRGGRRERRAARGAAPGGGGWVWCPRRPGRGAIAPIGVIWGLLAAVGLAVYFLLSAAADEEPLPPIVMAWAGMCVGASLLAALGWIGVLSMTATATDVNFLHYRVSWVVPVLGLSLVAAVIAYVAGIGAARRLGAKLASFIGMAEVLFAILFAWLLLGQLSSAVQFVGGALILAGLTLVRIDELYGAQAPSGPPETRIREPQLADADAARR